jgi:hypothetical protein
MVQKLPGDEESPDRGQHRTFLRGGRDRKRQSAALEELTAPPPKRSCSAALPALCEEPAVEEEWPSTDASADEAAEPRPYDPLPELSLVLDWGDDEEVQPAAAVASPAPLLVGVELNPGPPKPDSGHTQTSSVTPFVQLAAAAAIELTIVNERLALLTQLQYFDEKNDIGKLGAFFFLLSGTHERIYVNFLLTDDEGQGPLLSGESDPTSLTPQEWEDACVRRWRHHAVEWRELLRQRIAEYRRQRAKLAVTEPTKELVQLLHAASGLPLDLLDDQFAPLVAGQHRNDKDRQKQWRLEQLRAEAVQRGIEMRKARQKARQQLVLRQAAQRARHAVQRRKAAGSSAFSGKLPSAHSGAAGRGAATANQ